MKPGIGSSHTPRNENANANTTPHIATLNFHDVNCSPQARLLSASPTLAATLNVASTKNTAYRPAQYQRLSSSTS